MLNILTEPIFSIVETSDEDTVEKEVTLPGLLAALCHPAKRVRPAAIRQHQMYPLHTWLVHLAALALLKAKSDNFSRSEATWREMLRDLTPKHSTAWDLLVEDVTKPGFCQPPVHGEPLEKWQRAPSNWTLQYTPDEADIYSSGTNHAPKTRAMTSPRPEHWVFTLIALQTTVPSTSPHTYTASRVGPTGRVFCGVRSSDFDMGGWFRRDLTLVREQRRYQLSVFSAKGHAILWLLPWDGSEESQLLLRDLDPQYLDVARIIRLVPSIAGGPFLMARTAPSSKSRVEPTGGNTLDPWTPLQPGKKASSPPVAVVSDDTGWRYSKIHQIMWSGELPSPPAAAIRVEDGSDPVLYVAGIVLEPLHKGNSLGFHERVIPVPSHYLMHKEESAKVAERSTAMIQTVDLVEEALTKGLKCFFPNQQEKMIPTFMDNFDRAVDAVYFDVLFDWDPYSATDDHSHLGAFTGVWQSKLRELAVETLESAEKIIPATRRIRASALAFNAFDAASEKKKRARENRAITSTGDIT